MAFRVLIVDDDPQDLARLHELLAEAELEDLRTVQVVQLGEAIRRLREGGVDLVFLSLWLPDSYGIETFSVLHRVAPDVPMLVVAEPHDEPLALRAVEQGARGFVVKGRWDGALVARPVRFGRRDGLGEFFRAVLR